MWIPTAEYDGKPGETRWCRDGTAIFESLFYAAPKDDGTEDCFPPEWVHLEDHGYARPAWIWTGEGKPAEPPQNQA